MAEKKAKLVVILKANDTVVLEVENPFLWQQVLASTQNESAAQGAFATPEAHFVTQHSVTESTLHVGKFAKSIGVTLDEVVGALDPSTETPYLHLDVHCWEAMKKQTPPRGPSAMSPVAVAGTLLALWFREAGLGHPTQAQAQEVLDTINAKDNNPSRGVKSAKWLQARRGGTIMINPSQNSRAVQIAKAFCVKKWKDTEK